MERHDQGRIDARTGAHRDERGFTLIEILVVLAIIAAIVGIAAPMLLSAKDTKNVVIDKTNLKNIAMSIESYKQRFKKYPMTSSGLQFILAPWKTKIINHTVENLRSMYICPGDDMAESGVDNWQEYYGDVANIDPSFISYAGRNSKQYPLRSKNADQEVIACTAGGPDGNVVIHKAKINFVYLNATLGDLDVIDLPGGDESAFEVGENSPFDKLTKLNKRP